MFRLYEPPWSGTRTGRRSNPSSLTHDSKSGDGFAILLKRVVSEAPIEIRIVIWLQANRSVKFTNGFVELPKIEISAAHVEVRTGPTRPEPDRFGEIADGCA